MQPRNLALALVSVVACTEPDEDRAASFQYIHATIIEPYCATVGCHSAATSVEDLDFSTPDLACAALEERVGLISLLRGQGADDDYPQMPPDVPLGEDDIQLMQDWEDLGWPCD